MIGTWMQSVAQAWLVLELTGSGTALGLGHRVADAAGAVRRPLRRADRRPRRQAPAAGDAPSRRWPCWRLSLGLLTVTGQRPAVDGLRARLRPRHGQRRRQPHPAVVRAGNGRARTHLRNAVTLNSVLVNAARAIGPAVAGILIATIGVGICFLINAGTFAAVIVRPHHARHAQRCARRRPPLASAGQLREGFALRPPHPDACSSRSG